MRQAGIKNARRVARAYVTRLGITAPGHIRIAANAKRLAALRGLTLKIIEGPLDGADSQLVLRLEQAVDRVVEEYDGDEAVFERANREVQEHYRSQAHKAEVSERRQVEAARGRDRMETAKRSAADTIAARLGERKPPQFVQALLNQAWADVLTLTALRHG